MQRDVFIDALERHPEKVWDVIIIGGGATGLGCAVDAASRGYSTLLLEQHDFSKGTSSRSTKLVHGGVRYLKQGDVSLVLEALKERGLLLQNAPHLVRNQSFVIPTYDWWGGPFYTVGLKVYDMMAGKFGLGPSKNLNKQETLSAIPNVEQEGLNGGVKYHDGQFDDARLAINLAQTAEQHGASVINYMKVRNLVKDEDGLVKGVVAEDRETEVSHTIQGNVVINATGVFVDKVLKMDNPDAKRSIQPSRGVHLVLDKSFLQGEHAIMIPKTSDGRVLFLVPWHDVVIVGTTDTLQKKPQLEPTSTEEDIEFILNNAQQYLAKKPTRADVLSVFAGLRPLPAPKSKDVKTKAISRGHQIIVALSGLVTVIGGKWTTYRKMAEEIIDKASMVGGLDDRECMTKNLKIHGWQQHEDFSDPMYFFGSDRQKIEALWETHPALKEKVHPAFHFTKAEVVWSTRHEMARTVEDILSRRQRALLFDARSALEAASIVAEVMAQELGKDQAWIEKQIRAFTELASGYILN
ncbi:MAG: glycerol-3-phosphate dehydrogenase/oxidase [Saprospiraceae bacterium]|nr:glycerol-3-phosphate dehydrogenase/oxidase [Saprospiraceae bacterium]